MADAVSKLRITHIIAALMVALAAIMLLPARALAITGEFQTIDGYTFCLDTETGEYLVDGIYEVDGESYYFRPAGSKWGPAGSIGTGWMIGYNGHDFFFDRETGKMYKDGIFQVGSDSYYFRGADSPWGPEGSMGKGWVRGYEGNDYFFDRTTGKMYKGGEYTVDGTVYVFGDDGAVRNGWVTVNGYTFYVDPLTGKRLQGGIYQVDGSYYYFRPAGSAWGPAGSIGAGWMRDDDGYDYFFDRTDGHMYMGINLIDGVGYYFRGEGNAYGPAGSMGKGWVRGYEGHDYFFDRTTGKMYADCIAVVDGGTYFFGSDGAVQTGWAEVDGYRYYLDPATGRPLSGGIFEVDGQSYYFRPAGSSWGPEGSMGTGWMRNYGSAAKTYFFDRETGAMYRGGIFKVGDADSYLFDATGAMQTGWAEVDGYTYYFGTDGKMYTGIRAIGSDSYYFRLADSEYGPEGSQGKGWVRGYGDPAKDYFFDRETGKLVKDCKLAIDGKTYYFGADGAAKTGWITEGGYRFYIDPETYDFLQDGIFKIDDKYYYFRGSGSSWGPAGSMGTGWVRDYGSPAYTYYFDRTDGHMYVGGIFAVGSDSYYFRPEGSAWGPAGSMGYGWMRNYNGYDYFFDRSTGKMYKGATYTIDGEYYRFDSNGRLVKTVAAPAWSWTDEGWVSSNGEIINGAIAKGIDVSEWNGTVDWAKVKADGISFAILRVGYGYTIDGKYTADIDAEFERNAAECERLGIPYGAYIYSYARNATMAAAEADAVIKFLEGHTLSLPVYIDIEDINAQSSLKPADFASMATAFCTKIEQAGYTPGVYSMLSWFEVNFTSSVFDSWSKWIAQYYSECQYEGTYDIWQCSGSGTVAGINYDVDLNFMFTDLLNGTGGGGETPVIDDPTPSGQVLANGVYEIAVASSPTLVLGVTGASTEDRANIGLETDTNANSQRFRITWDYASEAYMITNMNSGCVMDLAGSEAVAGANIQQYHAVGWLDQRWVITKVGSNYRIASAVDSRYYLTLGSSTPAAGVNVQLTDSSSNATTFTIRAV